MQQPLLVPFKAVTLKVHCKVHALPVMAHFKPGTLQLCLKWCREGYIQAVGYVCIKIILDKYKIG